MIRLERQLAELRADFSPLRPVGSVAETFGMLGKDADFEEIAQLGREHREQVNSEDRRC